MRKREKIVGFVCKILNVPFKTDVINVIRTVNDGVEKHMDVSTMVLEGAVFGAVTSKDIRRIDLPNATINNKTKIYLNGIDITAKFN